MASSYTRITHRGNVKVLEWEIPDFLNHCEEADGNGLHSDPVFFLRNIWGLNMWFSKQPLCACLMRFPESSLNDCSVQWSVGIKKVNGQVERVGETFNSTFHRGEFYEHFRFTSRSYIEQNRSEFLPSGTLTIVCTFDISDPADSRKAAKRARSQKYIEKLSDDLEDMMSSGDDSDFTVKVKGEEFHLHRNILAARSPVFRSMLKHEMKEKTDGFVCINDCEPSTFSAFVHFLYSARMDEISTETVFELYTLADKYQVDDLKSACLDFIRETLSVDTFCDVVSVALTYGLKDLLDQATDFFAQNTIAVIETVEWMDFVRKQPKESIDMHRKAILINESKCSCKKTSKNERKRKMQRNK